LNYYTFSVRLPFFYAGENHITGRNQKMKKHVKWLLLALSLVCITGAVGCGGKEDEQAATSETFSTEDEILAEGTEETEEEAEVEEEVAPEGMYRSELTNEWISEDLKNQRPLAVMVDNEKT